MEATDSLRWAAYHRVLSFAVTLVGGGFVALGLWLGLWDALTATWTAWPTIDPLLTAEGAVGGTLATIGIVVWRLGTTAVATHVRTQALEEALAERYDTERVKSEVLTVLDERLEEMHHDIERIRFRTSREADDTDALVDDRLDGT